MVSEYEGNMDKLLNEFQEHSNNELKEIRPCRT
jgi:hypothetical protein